MWFQFRTTSNNLWESVLVYSASSFIYLVKIRRIIIILHKKGRAGAPRLVVDHIHKCWCVISFLQKLSNVVKSMKMQLQFLLPTNILDDRKGGCHEVNTTFKVVRHNRKNFQTCQNHQIEMWYDH